VLNEKKGFPVHGAVNFPVFKTISSHIPNVHGFLIVQVWDWDNESVKEIEHCRFFICIISES
jgi:hypothetical protein